MKLRRRSSRWAVSALVLALLLVIAAWLASNWNDAPPQPRPAALQLPQPSLPDARNAYFTLAGLHAAPDRDPSTAGQALWKHQLERVTAASSDRFVPAHDKPPPDDEHILGKLLPGVSGPPLACESPMHECVARWIDAADALRRQRDEHALFGARCERLLERDFVFDEALAPMRSTAEPLALHATGASGCSKWFTSGAVLAWVQHDRARAGSMLALADRLNRALLDASHSLIGQMVAVRLTRNTLDVASALAVRDPGLRAALLPLLEPLPDPLRSIRRWMVVEAAFQRGAITEIERGPREPSATGNDTIAVGDLDVGAWLFRHHIGWHPQRTMQLIDAQWLRWIAQLDGGLEAAMRAHATDAADSAQGGVLHGLTWVNPVGSALVNVGRPAFAAYLARHADLELHHQVTTLAVNAAASGVPAAQRRIWTATQPLPPAARERIAWSDDGQVLRARTWLETAAPGQQVPPREAIGAAWPVDR